MSQKCYIQTFVDEFLATGKHKPLVKMMFSDKQWNEVREQLASRGIAMHETMFGGMPAFGLENITQDVEMRGVKYHQIRKSFANLDAKTINTLLDLPVNALTRSIITGALQYSTEPYNTVTQQDFYGTYDQTLIDARDSNLLLQFLPNWTFVSAAYYDFDAPAHVIGANVDLTPSLVRSINSIMVSDGGNVIKGYKIPSLKAFNAACNMHTPFVMYTNRRDSDIEHKLCMEFQPHVRSRRGMVGNTLTRGVFVTKKPIVGELWFNESAEMLRILKGEKTL